MPVILTLHSALLKHHYLPVELRLLIETYLIEKLDNDSIQDTLLQYKYEEGIEIKDIDQYIEFMKHYEGFQ